MCQDNVCQGGLASCISDACNNPKPIALLAPATLRVEIWARKSATDDFEQLTSTATTREAGLVQAKAFAALNSFESVCLELWSETQNQLKLGMLVRP